MVQICRGIHFGRDYATGIDESPSEQTHSVTRFIERLKGEDPQAAGEIWRRYFERLLPLARAWLRALPDRSVDEEDILQSVRFPARQPRIALILFRSPARVRPRSELLRTPRR